MPRFRYIEKCPNINFSDFFSAITRISKPRIAFQATNNFRLYLSSANVIDFGLPKSVGCVPISNLCYPTKFILNLIC
jgi:hypothetical protein